MKPSQALAQLGVLGGVAVLASAVTWMPAAAQGPADLPNSPAPAQAASATTQAAPATAQTASATAQPAPIVTLDEALARARSNEPIFAAALAASKVATLDRSIARAALLPSALYHNQYLYTQGNGSFNQVGAASAQSVPKFIANNAVHEYASQAVVNETIGLAQITAASRATANAAVAAADMEISRRGLAAAVVQLYYSVSAAQTKVAVEERATNEAQDFVKQTQLREEARESAHADVIKAQLTLQQRQRDLSDAQLMADKAHLDLGVLLFPDPRSPYSVVPPSTAALADRATVESAANTNNPELKSALAMLQSRNLGVTGAKAAYLPDLGITFAYGIDAPQFVVTSPTGVNNLGYAASATLDIPVWDWFATQHRVKQAEILRDAAKVSLSSTQRTLIAQLDEFYAEAAIAQQQLDSLDLSVRTADESLRLTRMRYTAGEATVLEVVDAQNSLTLAELGRADGATRYQLSLANLQLLTGTI